jgi:hypothetical protein
MHSIDILHTFTVFLLYIGKDKAIPASYTVRLESLCALRLRYVGLVFVLVFQSVHVDITSNTFNVFKCTTTFRTHSRMGIQANFFATKVTGA